MERKKQKKDFFADSRLKWPSAKEVGRATLQATTWHGFADGLMARLSAKGIASVAVYPGPSLTMAVLCRQPSRRQRMPLPMAFLCRQPGRRQRSLYQRLVLAIGKGGSLPTADSLAIGKESRRRQSCRFR
jgi:hypothetical protein